VLETKRLTQEKFQESSTWRTNSIQQKQKYLTRNPQIFGHMELMKDRPLHATKVASSPMCGLTYLVWHAHPDILNCNMLLNRNNPYTWKAQGNLQIVKYIYYNTI
jgi:hypothetical protein